MRNQQTGIEMLPLLALLSLLRLVLLGLRYWMAMLAAAAAHSTRWPWRTPRTASATPAACSLQSAPR